MTVALPLPPPARTVANEAKRRRITQKPHRVYRPNSGSHRKVPSRPCGETGSQRTSPPDPGASASAKRQGLPNLLRVPETPAWRCPRPTVVIFMEVPPRATEKLIAYSDYWDGSIPSVHQRRFGGGGVSQTMSGSTTHTLRQCGVSHGTHQRR